MAVTVAELIVGPATVYHKLYTDVAAEPATPNVAPTGWHDMGGTSDGVNLTIAQSFEQIRLDQVLDIVMSVPNERTFNVETNVAQATLDHFKIVNNGGTFTSGLDGGTAWRAYEPIVDPIATNIDYGAVLVRGKAPNQKLRDIILRRTAVTDDVEFGYQKAGLQMLGTTWTAHYVSASVAPFIIKDAI